MKTIPLIGTPKFQSVRKGTIKASAAIISLPEYILYKKRDIAFQSNGTYNSVGFSSIESVKKHGDKSMITSSKSDLLETPFPFSYWEKVAEDFGFFEVSSDRVINKLFRTKQ